MQHLTFKKLKD